MARVIKPRRKARDINIRGDQVYTRLSKREYEAREEVKAEINKAIKIVGIMARAKW